MSTIKTVNVIHPSSATNNIVTDASGNVAVGGNISAAGIQTSRTTVTSPATTDDRAADIVAMGWDS